VQSGLGCYRDGAGVGVIARISGWFWLGICTGLIVGILGTMAAVTAVTA
jgi:hypothetical protein